MGGESTTKSADKAYSAERRGASLLLFDPEKIVIADRPNHFLFDPRGLLPTSEELVASILMKGVCTPVIVWKDKEDGTIYAVDGRQRIKANREANRRLAKDGLPPKLIKGIVESGDAKTVAATMVMAQGRVPFTPLQHAFMAQTLLGQGYDQAQVAVLLHCSLQGLKNYLSLNELPQVWRDAVEAKKVPAVEAYRAATLEPEKAKARLDKILKATEGVEGKQAQAKKRRAATGEKKMRSRKEIEARLAEVMGMVKDPAATGRDLRHGDAAVLGWVLGKNEWKVVS